MLAAAAIEALNIMEEDPGELLRMWEPGVEVSQGRYEGVVTLWPSDAFSTCSADIFRVLREKSSHVHEALCGYVPVL